MKKYQYKRTYNEADNHRDASGAEGWEMYAVIRTPVEEDTIYYYKREIPAPVKPDYSNVSIAKANELLTDAQRKEAIPSKNSAYWYAETSNSDPEFKFSKTDKGYGWRFKRGTTFERAMEILEEAEPNTYLFHSYPKPEDMDRTSEMCRGAGNGAAAKGENNL